MLATIETMICRDCREVVDIVIGRYGKEGLTGDSDYDKTIGVCPKCGGKDVSVWQKSKPCPKCDGRMEMGEGCVVLWD